jgi:hypothetical protein
MTRQCAGPAGLLAGLLLAAPACTHPDIHVTDTIEEAPRLASTIGMGDATAAGQLVSGFYDVEGGSWRWTAQKFAVNLGPPLHAARQGAVLELHLSVPKNSIDKLGRLSLSATAGGAALAPETYSKPGDYIYRRDLPAQILTGATVRVDFELDKAVPPGDVDKRELGIVASSVALVLR